MRGVRFKLPPVTGNTGKRRTPEESFAIRFPTLFRLGVGAVIRLPPGRLRRRLIARRIQQGYAAVNRRDYDALLVAWDAKSEYRPSRDLMPPDLEDAFHGHAGMRQLWSYWREAFDDIRWDPEEVLDLGDRFVVNAQQIGHGRGSGIAVSKPVFQVFTLRRGMVVRQEDFTDRSAALEAAGVSTNGGGAT